MSALVDWVRLNWSLLALVLGLTLVFLFLRTRPTEGVDSLTALDRTLDSGQPVVLEFYSNFWSACLLAKPIVDGLESQLAAKAQVVRLDVLSQVGRQAAARYGVRGIPALVVIDDTGQAVYSQAGIPRPGQVVEQIDAILTAN